jgi:hypothetical protein
MATTKLAIMIPASAPGDSPPPEPGEVLALLDADVADAAKEDKEVDIVVAVESVM